MKVARELPAEMPTRVIAPDADKKVRIAQRLMGLKPGFTERELRNAYLRGCRKLAPDKGGDAQSFIALQNAHAILLPHARRDDMGSSSSAQDTMDGMLDQRGERRNDQQASQGPVTPQMAQAARTAPEQLTTNTRGADGQPRFKDANTAYQALHGDEGPKLRGYGDWLKQDVRPELRPPEHISQARLHDTFENLANKRGDAPWTVSTNVVEPLHANTSVGHPIFDDAEDYSDGRWLADLQAAYGPA